MKIYEEKRAPNPRRVRVFLAEKGVDIEFEQVSLMEGEHKSAEFTRMYPLQRVPVLELDDGTIIGETMAICRYFEEMHPEPALMGTTALERALIDMAQRQVEFSLLQPIAHCFRHLHPAMAKLEVPQVEQWGKVNEGRALAGMAWLDNELKTREFVAGNNFTIADITALIAIDFRKLARIEIPDQLTHLIEWYEVVSARPSAAA
jgi:glutathione S-transferase